MISRLRIRFQTLQRPLSTLASSSSSSSIDFEHLKKLNRKDWLAPNEVIKILNNLRDPNSIPKLLTAYSHRKDFKPNETLYTLSINKLAQAKLFDEIETLMETIEEQKVNVKLSNDFFYNVIKVYGDLGGRIHKAIETLYDMNRVYSVWPSVKCLNFVLNLLVNWRLFDVVGEVFTNARRLCFEIDACCLNILIKGLCEDGRLDDAYKVFDEFPRLGQRRNVKTFSTLMHGLCDQGKVDDAFELLDRMEVENIPPDVITFNILISGLRKQGRVEKGMEVLETMKLKGCEPNNGSYQEIVYGLLDEKRFVEAKEFMDGMISKGEKPSFISYNMIIKGLCSENLVGDVELVLRQMVHQGFVPKMGMWKQCVQCLFPGGLAASIFDEVICEELPNL